MSVALELIAIRIGAGSTGGRKLSSVRPYYFREGYEVVDYRHITLTKERARGGNIYKDYFLGEPLYPVVNISAIVGENGSGKSTVVEFMMRIINNFAAATLGEYSPNQRTNEHIHFIEHIDGSLYYRKDDKLWEIRVKNRNVQLIDYEYAGDDGDRHVFECNGLTAFWDNEIAETQAESDKPFERWNSRQKPLKDIYSALFYTYISNYSIYAYNTADYAEESNSSTYEKVCRRRGSANIRYDNDDCNWLNGLFHKNDGYQCPIVLSPYRSEGNIDINNELILSKERLIALLISSPNGFSVLNGHLKAVHFSMKRRRETFDAAYLKRGRGENRLYTHIDTTGWRKLRKRIPELWDEVYGLEMARFKEERKHYDYALDYLAYKTLKISAQYPQYGQFHNNHRDNRSRINDDQLKNLVRRLSIDHSHITKKIRQTLAYIMFGLYEQQGKGTFEEDIQEMASGKIAEIMKAQRAHNTPIGPRRIIYSVDDLVPPPIYDTDIKLVEIGAADHREVKFETLSSGEKQQVFTISSALYHLSNIESIFVDGNKERITYTHCNVILEELELYFHPELQKDLVKYLLDGIRQMHFEKIKAIHICMVTHSPFILSDIQSKNILALVKTGSTKNGLCTFGANIHDLLKTSFLHDSVIGDYAQWMINRIIICLQVYQAMDEGVWKHAITADYHFLRPYLEYNSTAPRGKRITFNRELIEKDFDKEYLISRIMQIDEPIIRTALRDEYNKVMKEKSLDFEIAMLNKRIEELKQQQ